MITEQIQGNIFLQVICMIIGRKVYIVLIKVMENKGKIIFWILLL